LRAFIAVAKHRSFTRAAQELLITQPAISQQIRVLEADLDGFPVAADSDLEAEILGMTELVVVGAPGERTSRLMSWDTSAPLRRLMSESGVAVEVCTNDIGLLKRFVRERAGIAIVPRWSVSVELEAGTFELVPLQLPPLREPMGIVYSRSRRSQALAAFLTVVHDYKPILKEICSGNAAAVDDGATIG